MCRAEASSSSTPSAINAALLDVEAANMTSAEPQVVLSWRNLSAFVAENGSSKAQQRTKQILHGVSGDARPGEILALLGPSGAGKTTLLNILAGRPALGDKGKWSGDILVNGRRPPAGWKRSAAYSMQKDIFFEKLTVGDHLTCTAACRLPAEWSKARKKAALKEMVALLRLESVWDTPVGSGTERGLSGGELKRLNIATELLSRPRLLFLDEPFTGLDSSLAMTVLGALGQIAKEDGVAVLLTVHQPSSAMWTAFDRIMLMAPGGQMCFSGRREDAATHFEALGMPLPSGWSVADHLIEIVTHHEQRKCAVEAWQRMAPLPRPEVLEPLRVRSQPRFAVAVSALLRRQLRQVLRVYLSFTDWVLTLFLAAIFGVLWWRIGASRDVPGRQTDYISIVFFFVAQWSWAPLFQVINNLPRERDVLTRERASDSYSIGAWYAAKLCAELPLSWLLPAGFFAVLYPLADLPLASAPTLFGVTLLITEVATGTGTLIGATCFDGDRATTIAILYMVFVMCAGGYFVNLNHLPGWVGALRYTSFWYYAMGLFVAFALPTDTDRVAFAANHTLSRYSFSKWSWDGHAGFDVAALFGFVLAQRVLSFIALKCSKKLQFR